MKELVGKVITGLYVSDDQELLKFTTATGTDYIYVTEGDCCSETWFADILVNNSALKGEGAVLEVQQMDIPDFVQELVNKDGRTRQEYDSVYGYKILIGDAKGFYKGTLEIVFRNSSNGYYGGSISLYDSSKDWLVKRIKEAIWEQITMTWEA